MPTRAVATLALTLGILALVSLVFAFLALADIGQGEPDLTNEWMVVRIAFLVILVSTVANLVVAARIRSRP
jgi:uncharacterized membrane protein YhaH (DUF805 family)